MTTLMILNPVTPIQKRGKVRIARRHTDLIGWWLLGYLMVLYSFNKKVDKKTDLVLILLNETSLTFDMKEFSLIF